MTDTCYIVCAEEFGAIRLRLGVKACEYSSWQRLTAQKSSSADPQGYIRPSDV